MGKSKVTSAQFVHIYMELGGEADKIAAELGVGRTAVYQRVVKMRKAGVKLPLQRKGKTYDVKSLNAIIKQYKREN